MKTWDILKATYLIALPNISNENTAYLFEINKFTFKNVKQHYIRTKNSQFKRRLNLITCMNHTSHMSQILAREWQYQK